jgi:hypothetical protein
MRTGEETRADEEQEGAGEQQKRAEGRRMRRE